VRPIKDPFLQRIFVYTCSGEFQNEKVNAEPLESELPPKVYKVFLYSITYEQSFICIFT